MAKIKTLNLSVEINDKLILKNINLEFDTKDRILILGESGSGKSTLLLSLMGIVQRFDNSNVEGDIFIDDVSIKDMKISDIASIFGIVFQNPESQFCSLYPKDEVAFTLENQCIESSLMPNIIEKSLRAFDFPKEKENQLINTLSGGEQQRLVLSSINAASSQMLLLDEPTANLDPKGRSQVISSTKNAVEEGKGLIVVEHNLENWISFLDRLIVIDNNGEVFCDGNIYEMFYRYSDLFIKKEIWCPPTIKIYKELKKQKFKFNNLPCNIQELKDEKIPENLLVKTVNNLYKNPKKINNNNNKPILKIENLSAGYKNNKDILKEINLTINEGDFFALVGGNGSGKSTLSKVILKIANIYSGNIFVCGKKLSTYKEQELYDLVGYVFQNPEHQFLEDTVWSELAYSVNQITKDENTRNKEVNKLLEDFFLKNHEMNNPFSLSGGQKRRLSVATMLVGERKILILDEPTFGQDEKNAKILMEKLLKLNKNGMTIFMITHDLNLVDYYTNKTAVMHNGKILYSDNTEKLWQEYEIIKKSNLDFPYRIKLLTEGIL